MREKYQPATLIWPHGRGWWLFPSDSWWKGNEVSRLQEAKWPNDFVFYMTLHISEWGLFFPQLVSLGSALKRAAITVFLFTDPRRRVIVKRLQAAPYTTADKQLTLWSPAGWKSSRIFRAKSNSSLLTWRSYIFWNGEEIGTLSLIPFLILGGDHGLHLGMLILGTMLGKSRCEAWEFP